MNNPALSFQCASSEARKRDAKGASTMSRWIGSVALDGGYFRKGSRRDPRGENFLDISAILSVLNRYSPIASVAFAADGHTVASGSEDNTVRIWDIANGKEVRRLLGPDKIRSVAFAPDGRTIASGFDDGSVWIWDVASGDRIIC